MFKPNRIYRHKNFRDVDMYILSSEEMSDKYQLKVKYWNRFYMMFQGEPDQVEVSKDDAANWKAIDGL